jgi:transposase-like protein
MKPSKYKLAKIQKLKIRANELYSQGLSSRDVGEIIGRSHEWVLQAVKEVSAQKRKVA